MLTFLIWVTRILLSAVRPYCLTTDSPYSAPWMVLSMGVTADSCFSMLGVLLRVSWGHYVPRLLWVSLLSFGLSPTEDIDDVIPRKGGISMACRPA